MVTQKLILGLLLGLGLGVNPLHAKSVLPNHQPTIEELTAAHAINRAYHASRSEVSTHSWQPVEDTADFAYVLMSAEDDGMDEVVNLRRTIAQNLPAGVKLVILANKGDEARVRKQYLQWIASENLIIATDTNDTSNGFWARDSFPVPVIDRQTGVTSLVAAKYYRPFYSADAIAKSVKSKIEKENFVFVGGNLLADEDGNCFSVNSYRLFGITPDDFVNIYGCKQHHMMTHVTGLGDVDEVLKPLPGHRMLTNSPQYKKDLEAWGYTVILLPALKQTYRTYVNSLVVHDTVFMPAYGVPEDQKAKQVYESLGFKVIPIESNDLSDSMHGSIHCQTMAYPNMSERDLLEAIQ